MMGGCSTWTVMPEEGGDIIAGTTMTMDTDAATIAAGMPRGE